MVTIDFNHVQDWLRGSLRLQLRKSPTDPTLKQYHKGLSAAQRVLGKWLGPRTTDGQRKRAPKETLAFALLGCALGLLHVYIYCPRRAELSWTRYLPIALQRKLLLKTPALSPDAWAGTLESFALVEDVTPGDALLYVITFRKSRRWYICMTRCGRKRGTTSAPGAQMRLLEHLAGLSAGKKNGGGVKYKAWKAIGVEACCMVPLVRRPVAQIVSLEGYVISRDQPSAKRQGRKVESKAVWDLRMTNVRRTSRPPRWQRSATTPCPACGLNFWEFPALVAKALHGQWKLPSSPKLRDTEVARVEPAPDILARPYKQAYREVQAESSLSGPIDIYQSQHREPLKNHIATAPTLIWSIQSERLGTAEMLDMYNTSELTRSDAKRKQLRQKLGTLLKRRGVQHTGVQHVCWDDSRSISGRRMRRLVQGCLDRLVRSPAAKAFWQTRIQVHPGAPRSAAQGTKGKNMRTAAARFDMGKQRELSRVERYRARRQDTIQLVMKNTHVRAIPSVPSVDQGNRSKLYKSLKRMGCPSEILKCIMGALKRETLRRPVIHEYSDVHRHYLEQILPPKDAVSCTLDRNSRGRGDLTERFYHAAMQDVYAKDPIHYQLLELPEERRQALRELEAATREHRPLNIPPDRHRRKLTGADLGQEYLNLKEKCCSVDEQASAEAGEIRHKLTCEKPHVHFREVPIQGTGPTTWLRSGARALDFAHSCDVGSSLRVESLDSPGEEPQAKVASLKSDRKYWFKCRRCRRKKIPVALAKFDLFQQFKTIGPRMVVSASRRMLGRVPKRWGCSAVYEKVSGQRKPSYRLIKRAFRKRGEKVWSFTNLMRLVRWANSMTITRCGKHLLRRVKGTPMGASISPIKAEVVTASCERDGCLNAAGARRSNHLRRDETVADVLVGVRIADDGVVASKLECPLCIFSFLERRVSRRPLIIEREEHGGVVHVADRCFECIPQDNDWNADCHLVDKNVDWVTGRSLTAPRTRYVEDLGCITTGTLTGSITGRFHETLRKNA